MKKILQMIVLILALSLSVAALAVQEVYKVYVDGLACPFCAYGIEKKLSAIPAVEKLDTDIKTGTVTVTAAEGTALDEAVLRKAVEEAGFKPRKIERVAHSP